MPRITVVLGDELVRRLQAEVIASNTSRSALVREALLAWIEHRTGERAAAWRRRQMEEAGRGMDALAEKLGDWDPGPIIRAFRDPRSPLA